MGTIVGGGWCRVLGEMGVGGGRGVLVGLGVLGGAGYVPPLEQALRRLVQSSP